MNNSYGAIETNPITFNLKEAMLEANRTLDWTDKELKRVLRLRLLSDPGYPFWDVSYCYGETYSGEIVRVGLPFDSLPKGEINSSIIDYARADGVYAKGLGIFNVISTLI